MASVGARLNLYNIIQRRRKTPRPRVFKDRSNPLEELPADEVFRKYRFRPDTILFIVGMFFEDLVHPTLRNSPLPPLLQVLAALRFVATGSFYNLVGESLGVAKSTTGRAARYVCRLLAGKAGNYIKFPRDVSSYKSRFFEIAGKLSLLIFSFVLFGRPDFVVIGADRPASVMFTYILPQTHPSYERQSCKIFRFDFRQSWYFGRKILNK